MEDGEHSSNSWHGGTEGLQNNLDWKRHLLTSPEKLAGVLVWNVLAQSQICLEATWQESWMPTCFVHTLYRSGPQQSCTRAWRCRILGDLGSGGLGRVGSSQAPRRGKLVHYQVVTGNFIRTYAGPSRGSGQGASLWGPGGKEEEDEESRENYLLPETCSVANILMVDSEAGGVIFLKSTEPE